MRIFVVAALMPILGACLPSTGPSSSAISTSTYGNAGRFDVIALDADTADWISSYQPRSLSSVFGGQGQAPNLTIGPGDTVTVTIFEAAPGGLFSAAVGSDQGSKSITLPEQVVAANGTIVVPYVGEVVAAGRTPAEVKAIIEAALRDKAIEPQVIVTVVESSSTFVTIVGEVRQPGQLPLNVDGDLLLDVIAASGGSTAPAYDTFVRVTRGTESVTANLVRIIENREQNIFLLPGDEIYVYTDPQIYTVFGATAQNASFPFDTDRLTLAEAVGRAGGLNDNRANPHGVFLFRYEEPELYAFVRGGQPRVGNTLAGGVRVIYKFDLKDPGGYFAAQRFLMRDNDVLYVSNAMSTDLQKFLDIIRGGVGTVSGTRVLVVGATGGAN